MKSRCFLGNRAIGNSPKAEKMKSTTIGFPTASGCCLINIRTRFRGNTSWFY